MTEIFFMEKFEISEWVRNLHLSHSSMALGILLSGDRWSCITEAGIAKDNNEIVGISTIAPHGESYNGDPSIVGLYVLPQFRNKGIGCELFRKTIEYMAKKGLFPIYLDVLNSKIFKMIKKLPEEMQKILIVYDYSLNGAMDIRLEI